MRRIGTRRRAGFATRFAAPAKGPGPRYELDGRLGAYMV